MLENGQTLSARFTLVRRLGAGGHGEVWLAQDRERQGFTALKVLHQELTSNPQALAALTHTTAQVSALAHPNILQLRGLIHEPPYSAIAMEYAPGGDASVLRGRPAQEVLPLLLGIADALIHAHNASVIHGDLKPSNVLIGSDDLPRLTDFAAAGAGSPYNVSPQRLEGAELAPEDDIYGFGALAYELLSAYPPFYPQPTRERVIHELVPTLVPRYPAPDSLVTLVMACLAKDPQQRPVLAEIRTELVAALDEIRRGATAITSLGAAPNIVPPADDTLRAQWQRSSAVQPQREPGAWRRGAAMGGLGVLIVGALAAFFVLPQWAQQEQAPAEDAAVERPAAAQPRKEPEVDFVLLAQQKQQAEDLRASLDARWQSLIERAVERWAKDPAENVKDLMKQGDDAYAGRQYGTAVQRFQSAEGAVAKLEADFPNVLQAKLADGAQAIEAGHSANAIAAFDLALAMDKANAQAQAGLKRAQSLDQVLALVATARSQEQSNQFTQALAAYREALSLDPQMSAASDGVARIEGQLTNDAFGRAMATGYEALGRSAFTEARNAFAEARKIKPGAADVDQAVAQVQQQERTEAIARHLEQAQVFESSERWNDALSELRAALKLDSNVAAALAGVARVEPRAQLHNEFDLYLTQPERLFTPAVRQTAKASLQRASGIAQQGPVLRSQMEKLSSWLERAEQPVRVSLQSDNVTNVTIFRVGELGTFTERSLELAPGKYTIVGTRPGFRDVRREVALVPGAAIDPVVIRCEDPV